MVLDIALRVAPHIPPLGVTVGNLMLVCFGGFAMILGVIAMFLFVHLLDEDEDGSILVLLLLALICFGSGMAMAIIGGSRMAGIH